MFCSSLEIKAGGTNFLTHLYNMQDEAKTNVDCERAKRLHTAIVLFRKHAPVKASLVEKAVVSSFKKRLAHARQMLGAQPSPRDEISDACDVRIAYAEDERGRLPLHVE